MLPVSPVAGSIQNYCLPWCSTARSRRIYCSWIPRSSSNRRCKTRRCCCTSHLCTSTTDLDNTYTVGSIRRRSWSVARGSSIDRSRSNRREPCRTWMRCRATCSFRSIRRQWSTGRLVTCSSNYKPSHNATQNSTLSYQQPVFCRVKTSQEKELMFKTPWKFNYSCTIVQLYNVQQIKYDDDCKGSEWHL